jgi:hypothetical protein
MPPVARPRSTRRSCWGNRREARRAAADRVEQADTPAADDLDALWAGDGAPLGLSGSGDGANAVPYLLDERLGWTKRGALSPALGQLVTELASEQSYRQAVSMVERLVPQSLSKNTAHRLIWRPRGAAASS